MPQPIEDTMREAGAKVRARNFSAAYKQIEAALAEQPTSPSLLEFLGYVAGTTGDHARAVSAYRRLLDLADGNINARVNLATALLANGQVAEAEALCAGHDDTRLQRLTAYLRQQRGDGDVSETYQRIVDAHPGDFESWNNLGNALLAEGRATEALPAFDRALQLRPDQLPIYLNYSTALVQADRPEARQELMRRASTQFPNDARIQLDLGRAEAAMQDLAAAEAALRRAIALDANFSPAFVELGVLLENLNRVDDLAALVSEARQRDAAAPELCFLEAWLKRRRGQWAEALELAKQVPETIHPIRREQLIAELYDRLNQPDEAFAAFTRMNEATREVAQPLSGPSYLQRLEAIATTLAVERLREWQPITVDAKIPDPTFIVGFPRSGTTLLDTLLLNVPDIRVLEEVSAFAQATEVVGRDEGELVALDTAAVEAIRADYFTRVEALSPGATQCFIVDKHPLHMIRIATIARVFPNAHVVLVERHPYDAVLSCFMANFQPNNAMRSFMNLEEAARVYDAAFAIWRRGEELFPKLQVSRVRYERLVTDPEREMRPLLAALNLPWHDAITDNRSSAATRERVRTASYSQITEPVYQRAIARWKRYQVHLAPIVPMLQPWAEWMNYPV